MFSSVPLSFDTLLNRLLASVRLRVSNGDFTERGLARLIGISQPHLHHILKGMRLLTPEIGDALMATLAMSLMDLIDEAALGQALLDRQCLPGSYQHLPLLDGCLGPGSPFPDWRAVAQWIQAPSAAWDHARRPALVRCNPDPDAGLPLRVTRFALIDQDETARLTPAARSWYALRWRGAGYIRQIRRESGSIFVLGQISFEPSELPSVIELDGNSVLHVIRARIVWLGPDPRSADPFAHPGGWLPAPAACS